jgi:hypothetical protein
MADVTSTLSRLGQANGTGAVDALWLKVFSGEVMGAFNLANVFSPLHKVRTISNGKSAQFAAIGKTVASYHTPGAEIVGTPIKQNERVITIDDVLLASVYIAEIDELKNHYDVRAEYSKQLGESLADQYDRNVARNLVLAARASATVTGEAGGGSATQATFGTDAGVLAGGIFAAAQNFDEKGIPENERYIALKPAQYYLAAQKTDLINKDWGGAGAFSDGKIMSVAGIQIVKTNKLPQANDSANAAIPTAYRGDFSKVMGVAWHPMAVGTVKLMDVKSESMWDMRRQATLMLSKYACGHGVLRPEAAFELKTA